VCINTSSFPTSWKPFLIVGGFEFPDCSAERHGAEGEGSETANPEAEYLDCGATWESGVGRGGVKTRISPSLSTPPPSPDPSPRSLRPGRRAVRDGPAAAARRVLDLRRSLGAPSMGRGQGFATPKGFCMTSGGGATPPHPHRGILLHTFSFPNNSGRAFPNTDSTPLSPPP